MTTRFRSWLVLQDAPNADLRNLVSSLGLTSSVDATMRPRVTLTLRGDTAVLATPDPRELFEKIHDTTERLRRRTVALSTAPVSVLRQIHGRVFLASVFHVMVTCRAADTGTDAADDPYFRRLVELRFVGSELQGSLSTGGTAVDSSESPDGDALHLDPVPISLSEAKLLPLLESDARALLNINAALLPPTRDDVTGNYFARELRATRTAIASELKALAPTATQPAAVNIWRMLDDPFLRDIFLDGGYIDVTGTDGEATGVALRVASQAEGAPVAPFRARTLLSPGELPLRLSRTIGAALAADLGDTGTQPMPVSTAKHLVDWSTSHPPRPFDAGGRESGSWQRFQELSARLASPPHRSAMTVLQDRVLFPSRSRPGAHPDHDLAETEFIRHFWRCPWSGTPDPAWRWALVDLLKREFAGTFPSLEERIALWATSGHFELRKGGSTTRVLYPASAGAEEVRRWRLTSPLGTIFTPNAQVRLDDGFSKLDRGYQLV